MTTATKPGPVKALNLHRVTLLPAVSARGIVEAATDKGCVAECTDLGDLTADEETRMPAPSGLFVSALGIAFVAAVSAAALLAHRLP